MKRILVLLTGLFYVGVLPAQEKYFEGGMTFRVSVKSKVDYMSDKDAYLLYPTSETVTGLFKNGNERWTNAYAEIWYIYKDRRIYVKYKNIDTLYYRDYSADTSQLLGIVKSDSVFSVGRFRCRSASVITYGGSHLFYYIDSLRVDARYYKDIQIGHYGAYQRVSNGGLFVWQRQDFGNAVRTDSCVGLDQRIVDDRVFDLPKAPQKDITKAHLFIIPRFPGKPDAFKKYVEKHVDGNLGALYVKVPKDKQEASDTVKVVFFVTANGLVGDAQALNKNEVPEPLAAEAIRAIKGSPLWIPASIYGVKIMYPVRQDVIFMNTR